MRMKRCLARLWGEFDDDEWTAIDDVNGGELDPKLVMAARLEEMEYVRKRGVYILSTWRTALQISGKAPIAVIWIDSNKGDDETPNMRPRLVAKE